MNVGVLELISFTVPPEWRPQWAASRLRRHLYSVMPQVVAAWTRRLGHRVHYATYYGQADPLRLLPDELDVVIISSATQASALAYALAKACRVRGILTVLGGPHARCFPAASARFFDIVVNGPCDLELIGDILSGHVGPGSLVQARRRPTDFPPVEERLPDITHSAGAAYWRRLFANRTMIALSVMYIPNCMIFYFCITWLPTYLKQRHGFDAAGIGLFAGLPLLVSMPGDLLGGFATDRLSARYGLRIGRAGLGAAAYAIAGVALIAAAASSTPVIAASLIAVATGLTMFTLGAAWGTVIEVGRNQVSVVGAAMNSAGNLAAMLNPLIVAYSVQWFGSWNLPLYLMGVLFLVGAVCWTLVDPARPVFAESIGASPAVV